MNSDDRFSWRELQLMFGRSKPDLIRIQYIFAATHAQRLSVLDAAIDWIVLEHSKTARHRANRNEDALTVDIVTDLRALGFDASHDTDVGGHCDIVVEGQDGFLWLAEAKIHTSYKWLFKGFMQLSTRYSTGMPGQNSGSIIIYCKGSRVDRTMAGWFEFLRKRDPDAIVWVSNTNPLVINSRHVHERTGIPFNVRHVPVSLHHDPKD